MQSVNRSLWWCLLLIALFAAVLAGCGPKRLTPMDAPEAFPCAASDNIVKDIAPEAELADFSCSFKKWEGVNTLHLKVALKNVSTKPQRYRVNIFLDNGKAVGGLIPRKTSKGLVKPGDTASFVYPVKATVFQPKEIMLKVKTLDS